MRISEISSHLNTLPISVKHFWLILRIRYLTALFTYWKVTCTYTYTSMCSGIFVSAAACDTRWARFQNPDTHAFQNPDTLEENYLLFIMRDVLSFRRERVHKKIDSKKIVQTQNQKYPTNRSRCNTYLVHIFSYLVVWSFSRVGSYFSHLGNHYSAVIHPRFFSINHTIHDLKLSVGDVTETTVRDPHSYTTTVC